MATREEETIVTNPEAAAYSVDDGSKLEISESDLGPSEGMTDIPSETDLHVDDGVQDHERESDDGEYKPNFGYKVYDEQKEIPKEYHGLIVDKESEDRVRSLFERADGLEGMKAKNEKVRTERDGVQQQLGDTEQQLRGAGQRHQQSEYYRQNDIGLFLRHHGVTNDQIFEYANRAYDAKTKPEVRSEMDSNSQRVETQYVSNVQNQNIADSASTASNNVHQQGLDMAMQAPDVADTARRWDARVEVPGDFLQKVEDYGRSVYNKTQKNLTPFEAVRYVADTYAKVLNPESDTAGAGAGNGANGGKRPVERRRTIPTVGSGGGGRSPAKKRPKDIDDFDAMVEDGSYG